MIIQELLPPPMELTLRASTKIKTAISASQRQYVEELEEAVGDQLGLDSIGFDV